MDAVQQILLRIKTIESRFQANGPVRTGSGEFSSLLEQAQTTPGAVGTRQTARSSQTVKTTAPAANASDIEKMVYVASQKYNVDPKFALAIAKTESGLKADAVSPAGASGVMQLMPDTARGLGVSDVFDARQNIDGGVRYLRQMLDMFQGDMKQAAAAYNAGPQAVKDYGGIPPYRETRNYVAGVLDIYNNS